MKNRISTRKLIAMSMLAAISTLLMFLEMPIPFMPPFLKLDISAVPIMVGSFLFGPIEGVVMALLKSIIHLLSTQTAGVGELADFLITGSFALTAGLVYRIKEKKMLEQLAGQAPAEAESEDGDDIILLEDDEPESVQRAEASAPEEESSHDM